MKKTILLLWIIAISGMIMPLKAIDKNNQKLIYSHTFAPSEGLINKYEKPQRQELCINGLWDFQGSI